MRGMLVLPFTKNYVGFGQNKRVATQAMLNKNT